MSTRDSDQSTPRHRRVTVAWARVEPIRGEYDEEELSGLSGQVRAVRTTGMEPMVVLHDGALPDWVIARHGWLHPDVLASWGCYVDRVAQKLGVHVAAWVPILGMIGEAGWYDGEQRAVLRTLVEAHATAYLHVKRSQGYGGISPAIGMWEPGRAARGGFLAKPAAVARVLATGRWSFPLGLVGELSNGTPALDFVALGEGEARAEWPVAVYSVR